MPKFEIIDLDDGTVLTGHVVVWIIIEERLSLIPYQTWLNIDGKKAADGCIVPGDVGAGSRPPGDNFYAFNYILRTNYYSNGLHVLEIEDWNGQTQRRTVVFRNAARLLMRDGGSSNLPRQAEEG